LDAERGAFRGITSGERIRLSPGCPVVRRCENPSLAGEGEAISVARQPSAVSRQPSAVSHQSVERGGTGHVRTRACAREHRGAAALNDSALAG
jgi:hypothetical protein